MSAEMTRQELLAEVARLTKENEELRQQLAECQTLRGASVLVPQAELEAMKKDAERLVWLEQNSSIGWDINYENVELVFPLVAAGFNSLTDAIDQAMREGE